MTNKKAIRVLENIEHYLTTHTNESCEEEHTALNIAIKALEERQQGEWIRTGSLGNGNAQYECSNCHYGDEHAESQEVPYCWYCGAIMMKGDKE